MEEKNIVFVTIACLDNETIFEIFVIVFMVFKYIMGTN